MLALGAGKLTIRTGVALGGGYLSPVDLFAGVEESR